MVAAEPEVAAGPEAGVGSSTVTGNGAVIGTVMGREGLRDRTSLSFDYGKDGPGFRSVDHRGLSAFRADHEIHVVVAQRRYALDA